MKMTRHNGRSGKNGTYNPKHNDRRFNLENSEHIDAERAKQNIYWDMFNGYRSFADIDKETELANTFEDVEQLYYSHFYRDYVEGQNGRNEKNRHPERNRSADDIRKNKKTCPEESLFQLGTMDDHAPPEVLLQVAVEFMTAFDERFGSHIHILDWALHLDESTPHIHERHVFDCENRYGELCPQQEKALEALGFDLPEPDKKPGRYNNRKMVFDSACRALMFDIAKKHGLHLDEEPEYGGRKYLQKQDFIMAKQKEKIAAGEQKIEKQGEHIKDQTFKIIRQNTAINQNALVMEKQYKAIDKNVAEIQSQLETLDDQNEMIETQKHVMMKNEEAIGEQGEILNDLILRTEDVEALLQEVSEAAYDKAVEVVTDAVREETQKEDIRMISETHDWLLKPERKDPEPKRIYAAGMLDQVINKLRRSAQKALNKVKATMQSPDKGSEGVEQVRKKARTSVLAKLNKNKEEAARREQERREQQRGTPQQKQKKHMEL
ncbi:MAG: serine/arginine repetitive matrix protein 2 [Clostridiales bacterium]|nr:serine/arginine repetitive matrix protein 2 [Clostridiales bacterium]